MIPNKAIKEIRGSEGLRLKPYYDTSGKATIGWGATWYENGKKVSILDPPITKERAEQLFQFHINHFAKGVKSLLKVTLNQNQFGALVSLAYNIGIGNFGTSTLLKLVNKNPNDPAIKEAFNSWKYSKGKISNGLVARRVREYQLYKSFSISKYLIPLLLFFFSVFTISL